MISWTAASGNGRPPRTFSRNSGMSSSRSGAPCAINKMPIELVPARSVISQTDHVRRSSSLHRTAAEFLHDLNQRPHVFERRARQHAMAKVEDMPRAAGGLGKDSLDVLADGGLVNEKHGWIKVALDRDAVAKAIPGLAQVHAPVEPDDVAARVAHGFKQRTRPHAKVNDGNAGREGVQHRARVRLDKLAVDVRRKA